MPASGLPMSNNEQQLRLSTEGFSRATGKRSLVSPEVLLAPLEVLEVHLELPVAMEYLEVEATQNCRRCLEDLAATECNVVTETCRRLIQVTIFSGGLLGREIFPFLPYPLT